MTTSATNALQTLLSSHTCYQHITPDEQARLLSQSRVALYQADETIFLEGEEADSLWWIEHGSVKIYKLSPDGSEHILHIAGPGETFNDIAVYDGGPNPANVAALTPTKLWAMPAPLLRTFILQNPRLSQAIIKSLAQRVRYFATQIENLTLYSVTARLARLLLQQAESDSILEAGVTRKAIAGYLATTPETVSRTLRTLQDAGAIQFDRHRIIITNIDRLRTIAQI